MIFTLGVIPYVTLFNAAVVGSTSEGSISLPIKALINELFPFLKSPTTAIENLSLLIRFIDDSIRLMLFSSKFISFEMSFN